MIGALLPQLQALSIAQRVAGAAIGLALWLLPAVIVWAFMYGKLDTQYQLGHATASKQCAEGQAEGLAQAMADARAEWVTTQETITDQAGRDSRELAKFLADARKGAANLSEEFRTYATAHPLPAGCRADPGRVRMLERARGGGAPQG